MPTVHVSAIILYCSHSQSLTLTLTTRKFLNVPVLLLYGVALMQIEIFKCTQQACLLMIFLIQVIFNVVISLFIINTISLFFSFKTTSTLETRIFKIMNNLKSNHLTNANNKPTFRICCVIFSSDV